MAFSCLVLSLCMALVRQMHCLVISIRPLWLGGMRTSLGRLIDVQSNINCVRWTWLGSERRLLVGWAFATVFNSSGINLHLVSAVARHLVSRWTISSAGAVCVEMG